MLLCAPLLSRAESLNGLYVYMEYQVIARTFAPGHWYFLSDGRYLNAAPEGELSTQAFEKTCEKMQDVCGTYTLSGNTLNLKPKKASAWTAEFKQLGGGNVEINHIACTKVTQHYGPNSKLNGRYTAGAGYGGVMSANAYTFKPDGTVTAEAAGSVRSSAGSATSAKTISGTYRLSGNTLELTINGQTTKHLIYELPAKDGPQLMIDGRPWKKV